MSVSGHANPAVTDWDGDGLWDLLVSAENGSVIFFRNEGTAEEPKFAKRKLVVKSGLAKMQNIKFDEEPARGTRAQICVTDYNLDGKPDLIIGDYGSVSQLKQLDDEQQVELEKLLAREKVLSKTVTHLEDNDGIENEAFEDEEKEDAYQKMTLELTELQNKKKEFYISNGYTSYLWLYIRK